MPENKKAQAIVADMLILIILVSIMMLFVVNRGAGFSHSAAAARYQNSRVQRTFISAMEYSDNEISIAEKMGLELCGQETGLNDSFHNFMNEFSPETHFIFQYDKELIWDKYPCVILDDISIASLELFVPCSDEPVSVSLGVWNKERGVQQC